MSESQDSNAGLTSTPNNTENSDPGLHCAFQSQSHDELRAVSSTRYSADIQQCAVLGGDQDNAKVIGTEVVVTEKIFSMLPEEEKLLWHSHNVEVEGGSTSSPATQEVASTYGKVFRSLKTIGENDLPPAISQLLTSSSDPDLEKRHVSFAEDELTPKGSRGPEPGTRPGEEEKSLPEIDSGIEDEYLNDAVHRPVVNHKASHLPALTDRMPNDGQFLSETISARF